MKSQFAVYFSNNATARPEDPANVIYLSIGDNWDDFGLQTRFHCRVFTKDNRITPATHYDLMLGFWTRDESPQQIATAMLRESRGKPVAVPKDGFTLAQDQETYRDLLSQTSVEISDVLVALNDLVIAQRGERPEWWEKATSSRSFRQSFMRGSNSFFAFHNAPSLFDGIQSEPKDRISTFYALNFRLPTFHNDHSFELTFAHASLPPRRIAILIGKNGAGKSQTLYRIARSLVRGGEGIRGRGDARLFVNRLIAISPPGVTRSGFPSRPKRPLIDYRRIVIRAGNTQSGTGAALTQLARMEKASTRGLSRWELFLEAMKAIEPTRPLYIESKSDDGTVTPVPLHLLGSTAGRDELLRLLGVKGRADAFRMDLNGGKAPLSAGETTFVRFAAQLCLHIDTGTLVLVDEPETHLHPNLISRFATLLNRLLELTGSFAVVATHSVYWVREVPQSQVRVLKRADNATFVETPIRLKTFGADIGAISEFVFGDPLFGSLVEQVRKELQNDPVGARERLKAIENDLAPELVMQLREEIDRPVP